MHLPVSLAGAKELLGIFDEPKEGVVSATRVQKLSREVGRRMHDEMGTQFWLHLESDEVSSYRGASELFGAEVIGKLPNASSDIGEAGKCFALSRYTACVFHVMRVMEHAVQQLGSKLGVTMPDTLVWQVILDQVNKSIKGMDQKLPATKKYAEISAHLYCVKLAWRNEVMHPKATYTKEEAKAVVDNARLFLRSLVDVL